MTLLTFIDKHFVGLSIVVVIVVLGVCSCVANIAELKSKGEKS